VKVKQDTNAVLARPIEGPNEVGKSYTFEMGLSRPSLDFIKQRVSQSKHLQDKERCGH
jgi:hypothetical protein